MTIFRFSAALLTVSCLVAVLGCGSMQAGAASKPEERFFGIQTRQLPPEPVYNRLRWVHPPQTVASQIPVLRPSATRIEPVFHLSVERVTLDRLSKLLGEAARYDSYCSSLIADQVFSFNMLGTVDELADNIEREARITVKVDHENRQIRFLSGSYVAPEFYSTDY